MKMTIKNSLLLLILLSTSGIVSAQQNVTLYNMRSLPQRIYANPALRPDAKLFINVPLVSSHHLNFGNTALNLNKLTSALEPNGDSNTLNISELADIFNQRNLITTQYDVDLLHFGFEFNETFFSANITLKNSFKVDYPGDLFKLFFEGNGGNNLGEDFDLGFGFAMNQHLEVGFGASRDFFDDRFRIGARVKFLNGINNLETHRSQMTFRTAEDDFTLSVEPDIEIRMASALMDISGTGFLGDDVDDPNVSGGSVFGFSNFGMGLDLGASYKYSDRIHLSAAVNNLGAIKWNSNTFVLKSKNPGKAIHYRGVDLNNLLDSTDGNFEDIITQLGDSLNEQFVFDTVGSTYTSALNPEFYIGGNFHFTKNHNVAVLFYGNFYNRKFYPAATLSWNSRITRIFSFSLTYSYLNKTLTNAGAGLSLNLGPTQWYFVSDNIFGAFKPNSQNNVNLRFGMNLTFGRKVKEGDS